MIERLTVQPHYRIFFSTDYCLLATAFCLLPFPDNSLTLFDVVSTSKESGLLPGVLPASGYASAPPAPGEPPSDVVNGPNNPPWGLFVAILIWFGSVFLLFISQLLIVIPYARYHNPGASGETLIQFSSTDPTAILLLLISVIPAHLLTIGLVWAVVTGFGQRPFRQTIGWSWSEHLGFWSSAGLAVALMLTGLVLTKVIGGNPTQLDQIVASSTAARCQKRSRRQPADAPAHNDNFIRHKKQMLDAGC